MKRLLITLLLLVTMSFNLIGCGGGGTTPSTSTPDSTPEISTPDSSSTTEVTPPTVGNFVIPEGGYDGSEVTITFSHTMGANLKSVLETYIAEFNKLYPNIHIENTAVGGYDDVRDTIKTEITVGNQPNIAYCYPDHVALYNISKVVVTLDELIASQIPVTRADGTTEILGLTEAQQADFIEGYYEEGRQFGDGLMYTMPFSKSTEVLYYNETFFTENGLKVPTTWDEMEEVCARIKEIDPKSVPLGYDSEANWFITMCEQYGSDYTSARGNHFLFDNETNRAFVARFAEWYQKGYVTTKELSGAYTSGLFVQAAGTDGKSYMSIGSSAGATHQRPFKDGDKYPFNVGIASIPQVDPDNAKVISQGPSVCIFRKPNQNPQEVIASWLFVKFLTTSVEFQAQFSMASGYVPVIKSVNDNPIYAAFVAKADGGDNIAALSAKVCLEQEHAYYTSPAFNGSSTARDEVGRLMQAVLSGNKTLDEAFKYAIEQCEYFAG